MLVHQVGKASDRSCGRVFQGLLSGRDATERTFEPNLAAAPQDAQTPI
jgi:hypothetical protein